jgi:hypothetical protein
LSNVGNASAVSGSTNPCASSHTGTAEPVYLISSWAGHHTW